MGQSSKISWQLRRSLKFRSRRWRRRQVVFLLALIGFLWLKTIGEDHHGFYRFLNLTGPLILALPLAYGRWRTERIPIVRTLEDQAQFEYGVSFEALDEWEQKKVLANYRPEARVLSEPVDERVEWERLKAHEAAYRVARRCLLVLVGLYIAGYFWLPSRPDRPMDPREWLDPPVWVIGIVTLVLVLPQAMWMWMEPDEVGEPRVVLGAEREA